MFGLMFSSEERGIGIGAVRIAFYVYTQLCAGACVLCTLERGSSQWWFFIFIYFFVKKTVKWKALTVPSRDDVTLIFLELTLWAKQCKWFYSLIYFFIFIYFSPGNIFLRTLEGRMESYLWQQRCSIGNSLLCFCSCLWSQQRTESQIFIYIEV